jgi:hypothetical protein
MFEKLKQKKNSEERKEEVFKFEKHKEQTIPNGFLKRVILKSSSFKYEMQLFYHLINNLLIDHKLNQPYYQKLY